MATRGTRPNSLLAAGHLESISRVAAILHACGWAEANAGNLSIRVEARPFAGPETRLPAPCLPMAGKTLLVKRAGARMRDLARAPRSGLCLIQLNSTGSAYRTQPAQARPSTELLSHLAAHSVLLEARPSDRVVLHTHPTALISLSLLVPRPAELMRLLTRMHSEAPLLIQGRVAAIPFHPPGTGRLARATATALRRHVAVIWPCHGIIATGPDPDSALDIIEVVDKAARIALSLGTTKLRRAGLTPTQQAAIRRTSGLKP